MKRKRDDSNNEKELPSLKRFKKDEYLSREVEVGIKLYLQKKPAPVFGIVKQRPHDFHVHEVQVGGVVKLQKSIVPPPSIPSKAEEEEKPEVKKDPFEILQQILPSFPIDRFRTYVTRFRKKSEMEVGKDGNPIIPKPPTEEDLVFRITAEDHPELGTSKDVRKRIHQCMRANFRRFETNYSHNTFSFTYVGEYTNSRGKKKRRKRRDNRGGKTSIWKELGVDYIEFALYKLNLSTKSAVSLLSRFLHVKEKNFSFPGNKDKRALTTQLVRGYRIPLTKLEGFNKDQTNRFSGEKSSTRMRVGNYRYVNGPFRLGQLVGNEFTITLRNLTECYENSVEDDLDVYLSQFRDVGFINYYGMQRFGLMGKKEEKCQTSSTFEIGMSILKGDWDKVVKDLLMNTRGRKRKSSQGERSRYDDNTEDVQELRRMMTECLEKKNYEETIRKLDGYQNVFNEKRLLIGLKKNQGNSCQAFTTSVPRHMRMLYVHAYQSKIWNECVSARLEKYGMKCVVGDLVYIDPNMNDNFSPIHAEKKKRKHDEIRTGVRVVSSEEEASRYSVKDVLLPIPGCDILFPRHEVGEAFCGDLLKRDLGTAGFSGVVQCFEKVKKDYATYGQYRKIVIQPKNFKWWVKRYTDFDVPLVESDLDLLEGKIVKEEEEEEEEEGEGESRKKALILQFQLPAGCYATMLIREILKTSSVLDWKSVNEKNI